MNVVKRIDTNGRLAKVLVVLLFVCVIFSAMFANAISETNIPSATEEFYVNDFANLFTSSQKEEMLLRAEALAEQPEGVQVVINTVKSLDGMSVEDYANKMYNKYEIGREDRGVLILLSTGERQIRVEVGYGLESYLTDSKAGKFIDKYALSYLKNNKFDKGLVELQKALVQDLDIHFQSLRSTSAPSNTEEPVTRSSLNEDSAKTSALVTAEPTSNGVNNTNSVNVSFIMLGTLLVICLIVTTISACTYKKKFKEERELKEDKEDDLRYEKLRVARLDEEYQSRERNLKASYNDNIRRISEKLQGDKNSINNEWSKKYKNLERKYNQEVSRVADFEIQLKTLKNRYDHAVKIHPELNSEVDALILKEIDDENMRLAGEFDKKYQHLLKVQASSEIDYEAFKRAFSDYRKLSKPVQFYVQTDMAKLHQIHDQSYDILNRKNAQNYTETVKRACEGVREGTEENLPKFKDMLGKYNSMHHDEKQYVDFKMIAILTGIVHQGEQARNKRIAEEEAERRRIEEERRRKEEEERRRKEAERKRKEEEERKRKEEERRRREREEEEERARRRRAAASSSSFHSSSHSSSSFSHHSGGFGGHSGGGGASRGF